MGYGRLRVRGVQTRAHRHAYVLVHGVVPHDVDVLHRCDNPICVNPEHLFLGTKTDNMQDMSRKGRAAGQQRQGERHPLATISDATALRLRKAYGAVVGHRSGANGMTAEQIARAFVLPVGVVRNAVRGVTFKHLPMPLVENRQRSQ